VNDHLWFKRYLNIEGTTSKKSVRIGFLRIIENRRIIFYMKSVSGKLDIKYNLEKGKYISWKVYVGEEQEL
jgi:hypothetical protein